MGWMDSKQSTTVGVNPMDKVRFEQARDWGAYAANQPFTQYSGPWNAGINSEMGDSWQYARSGMNRGMGEIEEAQNIARQVAGYNPSYVNATYTQPQYTRAGTTTAGMTGAMGTEAGQTTSQNTTARDAAAYTGNQYMGNYFNPFLSQVGGNMVSDMGRARDMQLISDEDRAIAAGAYGGSRHGVADAETTRGFYDTLGKNLTNLYATGFDTASRLGMADADRVTNVGVGNADRTLQSDIGNANRALTSDMGNRDATLLSDTNDANRFLQSDMANMDRLLRSDTANVDRAFASDTNNANRALASDTANADRALNAGQFNSNQYEDAYNMRLAAGSTLGNLGLSERNAYYQGVDALNKAGMQRYGFEQDWINADHRKFDEWREYPWKQAQMMLNASGVGSGGAVPTTTTQSGGLQGAMSTIGTGLGIYGMANYLWPAVFASDENIKSDVRDLLSEDDVLEGVKNSPSKIWRYDPRKGGPDDGGTPHIGPMAQSVKRNLGIGTGRAIPFQDMLGAHHAAIGALARKVDKITDVKIKRTSKRS